MTHEPRFSISSDINAPAERLSLRYEGWAGHVIANVTARITARYLAMEATGLKTRPENPQCRLAA
jgi:hypothetical protein